MYLFVLCPPYCGSTVLWKLIATSDHVSALPSEGQFLPEVEGVMRQAPWDADFEMPWEQIRAVWDRYWNHDKQVLLEKSPPNLLRTDQIREHFQPVQFVMMVRNPYAHCEGLMRRDGSAPEDAAEFAIRCLQLQRENRAKLPDSLWFTYEQLASDPRGIARKLCEFLPQLGELSPRDTFQVHSNYSREQSRIVDLNRKKIRAMSPAQIGRINAVFSKYEDTLNDWGYELYSPTRTGVVAHTLHHSVVASRRAIARAMPSVTKQWIKRLIRR
jgi:hypothetical protein